MIEFYNKDCIEGMKSYPDKYFDLAIVDPPYSDGKNTEDNCHCSVNRGGWHGKDKYYQGNNSKLTEISWDIAPSKEYFDELYRVSKNQIIWGANYFNMPPCRCFIVWLKTNIPENFSMAMAEFAWTSFNDNAKVYKGSSARGEDSGKFHPTEKPINLYKWLLTNYANKGDKILDTHTGSASSLIACYDLGFDAIGFEIDEVYYRQAKQRLEDHQKQVSIFDLLN